MEHYPTTLCVSMLDWVIQSQVRKSYRILPKGRHVLIGYFVVVVPDWLAILYEAQRPPFNDAWFATSVGYLNIKENVPIFLIGPID
jgi:hypothetical protein